MYDNEHGVTTVDVPPVTPPPPPQRRRGRSAWNRIAIGVVAAAVAGGAFVAGLSWDRSDSTTSTPTTIATIATTAAPPATLGASEEPVAAVAAALAPSVVQIETPQGLGSGVIYDAQGYILTAAHVLGDFTAVRVRLSDGTRLEGTVVGVHTGTDVGVVKIDHAGLSPATLAVDDELQVGQLAVAIGSPYGLTQTVTSGVVSATARELAFPDGRLRTMIQTDASINPGNSGGALADRNGKVIGINDQIVSQSGGNEGVGFAIPIDVAKNVADHLVAGTPIQTAHLGVTGSDTTLGAAGAVITGVEAGSPAADAGLRPGDVVTLIDDRPITSIADLAGAVSSAQPGQTIRLHVTRGEQELDIEVTLGAGQ